MITSVNGIVAGLKPPASFYKASFTGEAAGQWHNLGTVGGNPGAWALGSPGMAGATVIANALGGVLRFDNPTSGEARLARLMQSPNVANISAIMLYDLLWYQSGIVETTTTAQTINSVAWPARDKDGTVNGVGVEIWMHCTTATTNVGAISNTTMGYTNDAGVAGRSAGLVYPWPDTAVAGTMVPFGLQNASSDKGVRSVQTVTLGTSYAGGQVELIALRRLATIPMTQALFDWASLGLPRCFNDSAIYMAAKLSGAAAGSIDGEVNFAHG